MSLIIPPNTRVREYLEANNIPTHIECGAGFCGACKRKCKGKVSYTTDPIAWFEDDELLVCCAMTKSEKVEIR